MQEAEALQAALAGLGHPVSRAYYRGPGVSTYFIYQCLYSEPIGFADDDNTATENRWRVDLYSKCNYTTLLVRTIQALKAAGFYGIRIEEEIFEKGTGYYHIPIEAHYLTEEE